MTSLPEIFGKIDHIINSQTRIRLLNIYKGLPITNDSTITFVGDNEIHVSSSRNQISCLYYQHETFIQGVDFPFTIRGEVTSLNLTKQEAVLKNFEIRPNNIGKRMNIRVEPSSTLMGVIQFKDHPARLTAPIADISGFGVSVFMRDFLFPVKLFQTGNEINISIRLPETVVKKTVKLSPRQLNDSRSVFIPVRKQTPESKDGQIEINAWGKILGVSTEKITNRYRVNIKLILRETDKSYVSNFITQRQNEIIQDLRFLTDNLFGEKKMIGEEQAV